jgi:hypothetical protein
LIALAAGWLASTRGVSGDWLGDSYPAVHALAAGHVSDYLSAKATMGPFATLLEAPFVALSGQSGEGAYGWACLPGLLAAGFLGLQLARIAARRGGGPLVQVLLAFLCLVNPLTFEALENGHPEEILTAALAVAAIAAAAESKTRRSAVLLGLAVASKQWAVVAILPVLMALPARRPQVAVGAAVVAAVLILPGMVAAPGTFFGLQREVAATGGVVTPWSAWYPLATARTATYQVDGERLVAHVHDAPALAGPFSHPLIVLLALAVPVALALRRRKLGISGAEAMALLALLALLRCALDPVDNLYYHEPLLLALLGWDAFSPRRLPVRGLVATVIALVFWKVWQGPVDAGAFNTLYLVIALAAAIGITSSLFGPVRWTDVSRTRLFAGLNPNSWD